MNFRNRQNPCQLPVVLFCAAILLFSSCRTHRETVYDPREVRQLSCQMGFSISNTDPGIPLYAEVSFWLGVPYRWNGSSRKGIDCSGLAMRIYKNVYSKDIPRSTSEQSKATRKISKKDLKTGDFVFFSTSRKGKHISHVGIYLKDGYFAHASTSGGVIISHLDEEYYRRAWKQGGRLK